VAKVLQIARLSLEVVRAAKAALATDETGTDSVDVTGVTEAVEEEIEIAFVVAIVTVTGRGHRSEVTRRRENRNLQPLEKRVRPFLPKRKFHLATNGPLKMRSNPFLLLEGKSRLMTFLVGRRNPNLRNSTLMKKGRF
jgi:hypothetical protein